MIGIQPIIFKIKVGKEKPAKN